MSAERARLNQLLERMWKELEKLHLDQLPYPPNQRKQ